MWPLVVATGGVIYALVTNYNTIDENTKQIGRMGAQVVAISQRVTEIDTQQAVKNSQFSEILYRLNKMEDKLDRIAIKR